LFGGKGGRNETSSLLKSSLKKNKTG
jgi:hypothetical protein